jgi:glycosyltransferase involved in cell wall biosynthesis
LRGSDDRDVTRARILLIGGDGGYSGVPRYLVQMVRALRDQAEVTVLSDVNEGGFDALRGSGARHLTIPGLKTSRSPLRALAALSALRAIIKGGSYDLIWAHSRMAVLLLRILLLGPAFRGRSAGRPRIAITHHSLPFEKGYPQPYARLLQIWEALMIRLSVPHHLFFLTETAQRHYCAVMPQRAQRRHRLHVLTSCSDLHALPPSDRPGDAPRVLVMTGRDCHQKNLTAALHLFAHLPDNYRLVLCGAGTDQPAFQMKLAGILDDGQQARVDLRGPLADVRPVLAQAAGYLLTSRYEGLPIGALEAWEAGLPLALTRIDGTAEILSRHPLALALDPTDPWRDAPRDAKALDAMIDRYLADREGWRLRIRQTWEAHHAFEGWSRRLGATVAQILGDPWPGGR